MKKDKLIEMADYLDGDLGTFFSMRELSHCVLGHASRHFGDTRVTCASSGDLMMDVFGIEQGTEAAIFLFAGQWGYKTGGHDPKAAAVRLRYVAQHGDSPSRDQWPNFERIIPPPVATDDDEDVETEEDPELVLV